MTMTGRHGADGDGDGYGYSRAYRRYDRHADSVRGLWNGNLPIGHTDTTARAAGKASTRRR
jgi:hypothetical protein